MLNLLNGVLHLLEVGAIGKLEAEVDAAVGLCGVVLQGAGRQSSVGYDNRLGIVGADDGVEDLDILHRAGITLRLNIVAHLEGLEQQDHHAAGKILQRTAEGHTDGDASRSEEGYER